MPTCSAIRFGPDRLHYQEAAAMRMLTRAYADNHNEYSRRMKQLAVERLIDPFNSASSSRSIHKVSIREESDTEPKMAWVIHCGGSQGFEAATILQQLNEMVEVRTIVRGFQYCEHSDTISEMPRYFQDVFDAAAYRSHNQLYVDPLVRQETGGSKRELDPGSGEIAVYARDYREIGRWLPDDADYVIGRLIDIVSNRIWHTVH